MIPQTWEDPELRTSTGHGGDNDPLDIIEFGSLPLAMGSITCCRIIGSFKLIDEGETDHNIMCIALSDPDANKVFLLDDFDDIKPRHVNMFKDWLKRYKTSDGKPENTLASEVPHTAREARVVVEYNRQQWRSTFRASISSKTANFWLASPNCRGY
jgi:3'-phosphoadenosine 5'-phosphosulfate synthase